MFVAGDIKQKLGHPVVRHMMTIHSLRVPANSRSNSIVSFVPFFALLAKIS